MTTKTLIVCLFTAAGVAAGVRAAMFTLKEPALTFDKNFPEAVRTNVMAILRKPECKYREGFWLNAWTSLQYDGDSWALNGMLDGLAKCPGVTIGIVLEQRSDEQPAWTVGQNAHEPRELTAYVNLDSPHIKVHDL